MPTNGHSDACHIDMSRSKYQFSSTPLTTMNVNEAIKKSTSENQSNCPSNSVPSMNKDSENHHVHFSNAGAVPEKEDIISLYGTPKEEMIPGASSDGYNAENEDNLSYKGNTFVHKCTAVLMTRQQGKTFTYIMFSRNLRSCSLLFV